MISWISLHFTRFIDKGLLKNWQFFALVNKICSNKELQFHGSKSKIKTSERSHWSCSGFSIVNLNIFFCCFYYWFETGKYFLCIMFKWRPKCPINVYGPHLFVLWTFLKRTTLVYLFFWYLSLRSRMLQLLKFCGPSKVSPYYLNKRPCKNKHPFIESAFFQTELVFLKRKWR